jgi:hypothetical protein
MGAWMGGGVWLAWPSDSAADQEAMMKVGIEFLAEKMVVDDEVAKIRKTVDRAFDSGDLADSLPDLLQDDEVE